MLQRRFYSSTTKILYSAKECKQLLEKAEIEKEDKIKKCMKPTPKVIIIGAGIAGLSAAVKLIHSGIDNVTVLEATDRPGGRIFSCWMGDVVAEVGAQWICGGSMSNPLVTLACQEGLMDPNPNVYDYTKGEYITSKGIPISKGVSSQAFYTFQQIEKQAAALFNMNKPRSRGSLMNFFTLRISHELNNFPQHQRDDAGRIMYGLTNRVRNRWGEDLNKLSANLYGSYSKLHGDTLGIPLGFAGIIAPLLKEIPLSNIRYHKIVEKIQWANIPTDLGRVNVKCCDYSLFSADYVIVTVSLGVLKAEASRLFSPKLPKEKVKAIKNLGFGNISKIFVEYTRPFWIPKQGPIKLALAKKELSESSKWTRGISAFEEIHGSNQVLQTAVSGKYANHVETLTEADVAKDITALLRKFTNDPSIPYPEGILRTKWKSDPFFVGTTCYMGMKSTVGHQQDLAAPVPNPNEPRCSRFSDTTPKIFFAGEATCPKYFSTVHGARMSGLKAAQDIIDLTTKLGGAPANTTLITFDDPQNKKPCN